MKFRLLLATILVAIFAFSVSAQQDKPVNPSHIGEGVLVGISQPLKDLPVLSQDEFAAMQAKAKRKIEMNKGLKVRSYPFAGTALPKGNDDAWQQSMGSGNSKAPLLNFEGQPSPYYPPDCNGTAGPNHYMQTVNTTYAIYSKTGTLMAGPTNMNLLFGSVPGSNCNDGDPLILYDEQADRWLAVEFSLCGSTDRMLIAVSTTNNPTGTWYQYSFDVDDMPDYEKFGIWQDGYYMGDNNSSTNDIYVFERSQMLIGAANPKMVGFNNPFRPTSIDGFMCVPPIDNDGAFAPTGAPGMFITINDDAIGGGSDQLWLYELAVNWANTASSTFTRSQQINVTAFDSNFGNNWDNIKQQGTTQELDAIPQVVMNVPQYRNFGSYQTIVCCHTVDVDGTDHAGVRWYELRKTTGTWSVRQTGTYAPDIHSRWMGSIMLNGSNKIGLGYSVSSTTMFPSIRFCGQSAGAYATGAGVMDIAEDVIINGSNAQTGYNRWGDYSQMSVDPYDNETFWFTNQYIGSGGSRKTKIASFKIGNSPTAITLPATAVTGNSATLNGTVNPNTLATDYHFEYGTSTSYGSTTTVVAAGNGNTNIAVNANILGLVGGTAYHFRVVATNSDGTTYGSDLTFTPGGAVVTTAAVTGITLTTATSGGNVTSDGGSSVTAYGVCWAATTDPTTAGSHTTDGAGIGAFTSQIAGLASNTTYHVRAYAINANGTFYGNDVSFITLCGIYTLPFGETFSGTSIPTCWSNIDNQGSGQVWQFGTFTGPNLTGNYAYLNSDGYGSGNSQNADLVTPTLDMSGYSAVNLQFSHHFLSYSGSSGTLSYSTNNGTTWTQIQQFTTTTANPATFNQAINAVAGQPLVKFKWNYTGTWGYHWAVDNVQITGTGITTLTVTPPNQTVTTAAGTTPFTVTTNATWSAVSDSPTWCTVTASGTGNGIMTAFYTQNTGAASRVANITVTVSGINPVTVTVTQAGNSPTLSVTPPSQNVSPAAGTTNFSVASNSVWTVASDATWCTVTPSGNGNGTIVANYTSNALLTARTANITVSVPGLTAVVVTVVQAIGAPTLSVTPPNQNVSAVAGSTSFAVASNSAWTTSSNATWCSATPSGNGNGTIVANYTANTSINSRIATITVTVSGATPVAVTVTQSGSSPTLSVTPSNQNVTAPAGNTSFNVTSNSAWTASSNASWCTVTLSGTGNGIIAATYLENTTLANRIANITVSVAGLMPVVVTVTQAGATPYLIVTPDNQNVASQAGTVNYTVTSNSPWTATCNEFWCTLTPSGNGNGTLVATFSENLSLDQRILYITVSAPGVANANVTLTQQGASPFLMVNPHSQTVTYPAGNTNFSVSSNVAWTATCNATWCTVTPSGNGSANLLATFTENTFAATRTANITVSSSGIVPIVLTVTQDAPAATLSVTPSSQTVTYLSGSTTFNITSNTNWNCTSDAPWCTVSPSGSGSGAITAIYQQNLTPVIRTANIQVSAAGLNPVSVQVLQLPSFVSIKENPDKSIRVSPNPTSGIFTINSARNEIQDMFVTIIDMNGKTILTKQCNGNQNYTFDLSEAAAGNYFLKVETGNKPSVWKLIVE